MDAWPRCLERLEAELPAEDVHTWLKPLQASQQDSRTVLYAPNAFVRDEVQSRYLERIRELLAHFGGSDEVALEIGSLPRAAAPRNATARVCRKLGKGPFTGAGRRSTGTGAGSDAGQAARSATGRAAR